jgi:hypothetical protein
MARFLLDGGWIIILILVLSVILIVRRNIVYERFTVYPHVLDPMTIPDDKKETYQGDITPEEANSAYKTILSFIEKNPSSSVKYIEDVRQKFFTGTCNVKVPIDFSTITHIKVPVF